MSWSIVELMGTYQINLQFNVIMNHWTAGNLDVTVAFDMEWPVNLETGIQGPVALIQVAYQSTVYLIKMAPFLENGHINLPHSFLTFLHSPLFKKVSVNIGADFKWLQRDCAIKLIATLLQKQLPKDPQICVSPRWADQVLPSKYTGYAVLDAYATSQIYFQLIEMEVAQPVSVDTAHGTAIALLAPDGQEVAHGIVAPEHPSAVDGINMPASLCKAKKAIPLSSFGSPPFSVVTHVRSLQVCPSLHCGDKEPSESLSVQQLQLTSVNPPPDENTMPITNDSVQCIPTLLPSNLDDEDSNTTPEQTIDGSE
ncbi:hypothetical protein BDR05DRAFT_1000406 [Suillus weaverae]|nr:hypothetical protein BDR05DRAFT_1000406 [Suillus weaverae]